MACSSQNRSSSAYLYTFAYAVLSALLSSFDKALAQGLVRHYLLSRYLCFLYSISAYLPYLSILYIYLTGKFYYYIKITSLPKSAVNCCKLGRLVNNIGCYRNLLIVLWWNSNKKWFKKWLVCGESILSIYSLTQVIMNYVWRNIEYKWVCKWEEHLGEQLHD